jgi:hypothetical protein
VALHWKKSNRKYIVTSYQRIFTSNLFSFVVVVFLTIFLKTTHLNVISFKFIFVTISIS